MTRNSYFAGLLLIGLAIIAYLDYWWPGIMFALGGAMLLAELLERRTIDFHDSSTVNGLILIGIGLLSKHTSLFARANILPIVLLALGILALLSTFKRES